MSKRVLGAAAVGLALSAIAAGAAIAAVGQSRTDGPTYDRNPSVVQDGATTYLFFARSKMPCNRLGTPPCNPDNVMYDMYFKASADGGKTYGPATLAAANPTVPPFRGRTIAATRSASGDSAASLYVYWADGGTLNQLYLVRKAPTGNTFMAPQAVPGASTVFNVEAVTIGVTTYVYTEELVSGSYGIYVRTTMDGTSYTAPSLVAADASLPKAIVDVAQAGVKITYVRTTNYPTVDVFVASSPDGIHFVERPAPVVTEPGVSNWDPNLAQMPNGQYYLFFAPDRQQGAGRQRIAVTKSNDFATWTAPHEITPGFTGGVEYWDYWPEGFVHENKLVLYYTSERGTNEQPNGIAHVWTVPGQDGGDPGF